ncbi:MAG: PD40 domain-containing protein [Anaerolineales bacterium]|nr:PD40 domain-containing protein [Anaerolineales bacterium]
MIPAENRKVSPESDFWPPEAVQGWSRPVPLEGPVNTAGGEDSPFVSPDGGTLHFFFTPDVGVPAQQQVFDGVTGIWVSRLSGAEWSDPERVLMAEPGEPALDGCPMAIGDRLYFCSIRAGNTREIEWYYAAWKDGAWGGAANAGPWMNGTVDVGEMHITAGYREIYFASKREGSLGGLDLWVAPSTAEGWGEPVNLGPQVNTAGDENRPFVSGDGAELWFDSASRSGKPGPAVYRCLRQADGSWGDCREIVSSFAGEPNLTGDGRTLYFIHPYYSADLQKMIEADIYVSHRL